jgi:hypothetical protein
VKKRLSSSSDLYRKWTNDEGHLRFSFFLTLIIVLPLKYHDIHTNTKRNCNHRQSNVTVYKYLHCYHVTSLFEGKAHLIYIENEQTMRVISDFRSASNYHFFSEMYPNIICGWIGLHVWNDLCIKYFPYGSLLMQYVTLIIVLPLKYHDIHTHTKGPTN